MRFNVVARVSDGVTRRRHRVRRMMLGKLSAVVALAIVGACATGHASKNEQHVKQMVVHLTNDLAPPSDVMVHAVSTDGVRVLLGDVPPNDHCVLRIPGDIAAGTTFHILADRGLGRPVVSQSITASSTALLIDWDLHAN